MFEKAFLIFDGVIALNMKTFIVFEENLIGWLSGKPTINAYYSHVHLILMVNILLGFAIDLFEFVLNL